MMGSGSVNKVFLIGNLGVDPEIKYVLEGVLLAKFVVATNIFFRDKESGEKKVRTEWHRVIAYNKNAELVKEYLKKGSKVFVEGYIKSTTWQGNDGIKRTNVDIIVKNICLLDRKSNQQQLEKFEDTDNNSLPF